MVIFLMSLVFLVSFSRCRKSMIGTLPFCSIQRCWPTTWPSTARPTAVESFTAAESTKVKTNYSHVPISFCQQLMFSADASVHCTERRMAATWKRKCRFYFLFLFFFCVFNSEEEGERQQQKHRDPYAISRNRRDHRASRTFPNPRTSFTSCKTRARVAISSRSVRSVTLLFFFCRSFCSFFLSSVTVSFAYSEARTRTVERFEISPG